MDEGSCSSSSKKSSSKNSLKKELKLKAIQQKKNFFIPPEDILKAARAYNRKALLLKSTKKITIFSTPDFDKVILHVRKFLKDPTKISIKYGYRKTMPNFEKVKCVIIFWTRDQCSLPETFSGAGGSVIILPIVKK